MSKFETDLTVGSVPRNLIRFSWPFLMSNLIQAVYGLADMLIVGRANGPVGVSAVQISGQITLIVTNLIIGFTVGGTVMIAQYAGAKRTKDQVETIGTMLTVFTAASFGITAVMIFCARPLLNALQTPAESFDAALGYLNICMLGTFFIFGYNAIAGIMRALGDSKHPLWFVGVACVINVALDILLVMRFNMGPAGAAVATVTAQGCSFIFSLIYLVRNKFIFDFKPRSFRVHTDKLKLILKIGFPSSVQMVTVGVSFLLITAVANSVAGVVGGNAVGITGRINSFAILPSLAMSSAISSMAGQNIGAGEYGRALHTLRTGAAMAFGISLLMLLIVQAFPETIVGAFYSGNADPETIGVCVGYLRIASIDYVLSSVSISIGGFFTGAGHARASLINALISSIIIRLPVCWIMGVTMGIEGMGLGVALAPAGGLIYGVIYLATGRWRHSNIKISREYTN